VLLWLAQSIGNQQTSKELKIQSQALIDGKGLPLKKFDSFK